MAMTDVVDWMRANPGEHTIYEIAAAMSEGRAHPTVDTVKWNLCRLVKRGVVVRTGEVRGPYGHCRPTYALTEATPVFEPTARTQPFTVTIVGQEGSR